MPTRYLAIALLLTVLVTGAAHAQTSAPPSFYRNPAAQRTEVGVAIGLWNLADGGGMLSGRVARRHSSSLATEVSIDAGRPDSYSPRYGVVLADVRLSAPVPDPSVMPAPFVTVGLAAAAGLGYRATPMVGFGAHSTWASGLLAWRAEIQILTRGHSIRDRNRLLFGLSVALP